MSVEIKSQNIFILGS